MRLVNIIIQKIFIMRSISLLLVSMLFCAITMDAQVNVGVKIGANFSNASVSGINESFIPNIDHLTGFTAGIVAEIPVYDKFTFKPELNYIEKGFTASEGVSQWFNLNFPADLKADVSYKSIEVPLLMNYNIINGQNKVYVYAGPTFGYYIDAYYRAKASIVVDINLYKGNIDLSKDAFNRLEIGGALGAGASTTVNNSILFVDGRYAMGFSDLISESIIDIRVKHRGFQLSAGYKYSF